MPSEMKKFILSAFNVILVLIPKLCAFEGVRIIPNETEINMSAGAKLSLECFGSEPVHWNLPSNDENSLKEIKNSKLNEGHYKSTLQIYNLYYLDTGSYSCSSTVEGSSLEEKNIYVYVRDLKHLLAFNDSHSFLTPLEHETLLIPCKPTFKDVNVTLWNEHEKQIDEFPFDPQYGFFMSDPKLNDSGHYYCKAYIPGYADEVQTQAIGVIIMPKARDIMKPKIVLHVEKPDFPVMIGQDVVLKCSLSVLPGVLTHFTWITPFGETDNKTLMDVKNIGPTSEKENDLTKSSTKSVLTLKKVTKDFEGKYVCTVTDNSNNTNRDEYILHIHSEDTSYLNITMEGKPQVMVRREGNTAEWVVKIVAHPSPKITWFDPMGKKLPSDSIKYVISNLGYSSKVIIKDARMRDSGFYELHAENASGKKTLQVYVAVEDKPEVSIKLDPYYVKNEEYNLKCTVLAEPTAPAVLSFQPCTLNQCDASRAKDIPVVHRNVSVVTKEYFGKILAEEYGKVTCTANNRYGSSTNFSYFTVTDPKPPIFSESAMKGNTKYMVVTIGETIKWKCQASGLPQPVIMWYKDGVPLKSNKTRAQITDKNETLTIVIKDKDDFGIYSCMAFNKAGKITVDFTLKHKIASWIWVLLVGIILFIICTIVVVFLLRKVRHEKKLRENMATAPGLYYFNNGQIESLNPDLSIGEQADLLPYDKKWEIPREKIKLGIQLGSGAFGVVMKAEVSGLKEGESSTTVAVKTAKKNADISFIKALVSELKIMSHLGQHLNVVNLLGACTSGRYTGDILVLVEYCKYGNLHNYLLKNRDSFINQVNPQSGNLDISGRYDDNRSCTTYIASNSEIYNMGSDYDGGHSVNTEMTTWYAAPSVGESVQSHPPQSPVGEDGYLISKPFVEKCSNELTTKNLICWSYQIARGMEYLASRKVLHGDLATRNILLAERNIVKICDFGFSKNMYQDENYTKKGNDPLPLKWLSIEALRDRVFSTQSDIWAYGIVLWEMFSLAKTPYPGKQFDQNLFDSLLEGYRMEKPDYATEDIYNLMLECWKEQPMLRPSFTECADRLGNMLEESVVQHYMELNDPYLKFNALIPDDEDYLKKVNYPTYSNFCGVVPPSPNEVESQGNYVNVSRSREEEMEMKPMIQPGIKSFLNPGYEGLNKVVVCAQINKLS